MGLAEGLAHSEYLVLVLLILGPKCDMPKLIYPWTAFFLDQGRTSPVLVQAELPKPGTWGSEEPGRQSKSPIHHLPLPWMGNGGYLISVVPAIQWDKVEEAISTESVTYDLLNKCWFPRLWAPDIRETCQSGRCSHWERSISGHWYLKSITQTCWVWRVFGAHSARAVKQGPPPPRNPAAPSKASWDLKASWNPLFSWALAWFFSGQCEER